MEKKFTIRCRAIILHAGKLLVVEHVGKEGFLVLPGGHLEWGEDIKAGLERELIEELGVKPVIGPLLYVHTFTQGDIQPVEFFFRIENAADYVDCLNYERSHAFELATITWVAVNDTRVMRPSGVWRDFGRGVLGDGALRYLIDGVEKM